MSFIQVPPDSTGKKLFAQEHTVGADTVQAQVFHLGDVDTPTHIQRVDKRGAASVGFSGSLLDSMQQLRVAEEQAVAVYEYSTKDYADLFTDNLAGTSSITYTPGKAAAVMSVGSGATDSAIRTSNRYHYYQPGVPMLAIFTSWLGDTGKVGNVRRWGYGDAENGLFIELIGTTLSVNRRSNTSGSVVDTRVERANWNGDKLQGDITQSGITLDLTKANFFYIKFAWFGVAPAEIGIMASDGSLWPMHTFENPGNLAAPFMRVGTLPVRYENYNTGSTSGTSELNLICTGVYATARTDYTFWRYADMERTTPVTVTTNTPILSIRVKAGNRAGVYPEGLNFVVTGGNVKIDLVADGVLTGATWTLNGASAVEGDIGATAISGGDIIHKHYIPVGVSHHDLEDIYETNDEGIHRLADDSDSYILTLVATKLDGTTVTVGAAINYKELS
jgi:hypothetical protein